MPSCPACPVIAWSCLCCKGSLAVGCRGTSRSNLIRCRSAVFEVERIRALFGCHLLILYSCCITHTDGIEQLISGVDACRGGRCAFVSIGFFASAPYVRIRVAKRCVTLTTNNGGYPDITSLRKRSLYRHSREVPVNYLPGRRSDTISEDIYRQRPDTFQLGSCSIVSKALAGSVRDERIKGRLKSWRVGTSKWERSSALEDGTAKEAIVPSTISHHVGVYGDCASSGRRLVGAPMTALIDIRLPEQRDLCRITPECANIVLKPTERKALVEHPNVEQPEFGHFFAVEESEWTQSIILSRHCQPHCDHALTSQYTYDGHENNRLANLLRYPCHGCAIESWVALPNINVNMPAHSRSSNVLTVYPSVRLPPYNHTSTGKASSPVPVGLQIFSVKQSSLALP